MVIAKNSPKPSSQLRTSGLIHLRKRRKYFITPPRPPRLAASFLKLVGPDKRQLVIKSSLRLHPETLTAQAAICAHNARQAYKTGPAWIVIFGIKLRDNSGRRCNNTDLTAV